MYIYVSMCIYIYIYIRGIQMRGVSSSWRIHLVPWRLIIIDLHYGACFMSPDLCPEFWGCSYFFWKIFVPLVYVRLLTTTKCVIMVNWMTWPSEKRPGCIFTNTPPCCNTRTLSISFRNTYIHFFYVNIGYSLITGVRTVNTALFIATCFEPKGCHQAK